MSQINPNNSAQSSNYNKAASPDSNSAAKISAADSKGVKATAQDKHKLHASQNIDFGQKEKVKNAGNRVKGFMSGIIKFISRAGMIGGGIAAGLGYLTLGKYLAIPGILVAIPSALIYFAQPSTKQSLRLDYQGVVDQLSDLIKFPHKLESEKVKTLFDNILKNASKYTKDQREKILESLQTLPNKFMNAKDYKNNLVLETVKKVQKSLARTITELERFTST